MDFNFLIRQLESLISFQVVNPPAHSFFVRGISDDTRCMGKGDLFVEVTGNLEKAHAHVQQAIAKGALSVCATQEIIHLFNEGSPDVSFIQVENPRQALSILARLFYPEQPENVVAVTGTNGKTSVVTFVRQIWEQLGYKSASLGTLGLESNVLKAEKNLTTPPPIYLHQKLEQMKKAGVSHLAMEASSHGIDQYRLDSVHVQAAAFTNLSPDHLDYHKTQAGYLEAKSLLFSRVLDQEGTAVLNADSPQFSYLKEKVRSHRIISYGKKAADIVLKKRKIEKVGQRLSLSFFGEDFDFLLPLVGTFQVENVLCALGLVWAINPDKRCLAALENLVGVPGRIEQVATHRSGAKIYVDYAHASEGIHTVLTALREHTPNHLWIVFGAGGERDATTRSLMGEVAHQYADHVIVTDDNPRYEDAQKIRSQILTGVTGAIEIPDRRQAIRYALENLDEGDTLVVTGKGPEDGQIIQGVRHPFLDKRVIHEELERLG